MFGRVKFKLQKYRSYFKILLGIISKQLMSKPMEMVRTTHVTNKISVIVSHATAALTSPSSNSLQPAS